MKRTDLAVAFLILVGLVVAWVLYDGQEEEPEAHGGGINVVAW